MKHTRLAAIVAVVLGLAPVAGAGAQSSATALKAFPDFLSVRSEFLSALITAAPARALAFATAYRDTPAGRIRISVEREDAYFYVLFQRERDGAYPLGSRGNMIIKRDVAKGFVTRVVWYLSDDGLSWISLSPKNERTVVDYVVAGSLVRGGYSVSRLIYNFFTSSFSYMHDATRAGLDWAMVLGEPGAEAPAAFAAALGSGRPGAAEALLAAARDFTSVWEYFSVAGHAGATPAEESSPRSARVASGADLRDPGLSAAPAWSEAKGLALESAGASLLDGIASGSAFIALVSGAGQQPSRRLAVVPYRDAEGAYVIAAVDALSRVRVDFGELVAAMPGASVRLFRVPLPVSR